MSFAYVDPISPPPGKFSVCIPDFILISAYKAHYPARYSSGAPHIHFFALFQGNSLNVDITDGIVRRHAMDN